MQTILALTMLIFPAAWAGQDLQVESHSHEGHIHEQLIDGKNREVDPDRFDEFVGDLSNSQIAVVSVKGMVCDFCARGIEKTFNKDKTVQKIDVDLSKGKVIIAYTRDKKIDYEEIKKKILSNGQSANNLQILVVE
jgi:copper chaperone CopZ